MFNLAKRKLFFYSKPIDMRFGIRRAQILVHTTFDSKYILSSAFIFVSIKRDQIKIYLEDEYSYWLLQNKLIDKRFKFPDFPKSLEINTEKFDMFLKGLEVIEEKRKPREIDKILY